jgi:copper chaperone CopZ
MQQQLTIEGMHCGGCVSKVKRILGSIPGVDGANVSLPNIAVIDVTTKLSLPTIEAALKKEGSYEVREGGPSVFERIRTFLPLICMFLAVVVWATVLSFPLGHHWTHDWMRHFMGGFFLLFGALKVSNLKNFAVMYKGYDLLAARAPVWGYVYPFVELSLGVLYTLDVYGTGTNIVTAVLMTFGAIGIVRKLQRGGDQTCACLGGFFSVPLTWVTVAENMLMAVMAVYMLFLH